MQPIKVKPLSGEMRVRSAMRLLRKSKSFVYQLWKTGAISGRQPAPRYLYLSRASVEAYKEGRIYRNGFAHVPPLRGLILVEDAARVLAVAPGAVVRLWKAKLIGGVNSPDGLRVSGSSVQRHYLATATDPDFWDFHR
jgi:hypothetical protein